MSTFAELQPEYERLCAIMAVRLERTGTVDRIARKLLGHKAQHQTVAVKTGVPWFVIAALHNRERTPTSRPISATARRSIASRASGATAYWHNTSTPIAHGWTSYTSTFTSAGGTLGTTTLNRARFIRYGMAVHFCIDVTITSAGTAPTGDLRFTLPVGAANVACAGTVSGREAAINNNLIGGNIDGTNARGTISFNAGATPTGNGNRLEFGGTYETA